MGGRRDARKQPGPGRRAAWAAAAGLTIVAWAGCDMRDEPVRVAQDGGIWRPILSAEQPAGPERGVRAATALEFVEGYEAAARLAAAEGRPLFLVFGASWCRWSGEMARGPLSDREIVSRTRRFVCVFVDADRDAATCRAFDVAAFPTLIVIGGDGQECFRATGSVAPASLAAALDAVPSPQRLAAEASDVTR